MRSKWGTSGLIGSNTYMTGMSLKPITYVALAAGVWLAVDAPDIVAACERSTGDPQTGQQCQNIPDAIEYLTVVTSAASATTLVANMTVQDDRSGYIYAISVSGKTVTDASSGSPV